MMTPKPWTARQWGQLATDLAIAARALEEQAQRVRLAQTIAAQAHLDMTERKP